VVDFVGLHAYRRSRDGAGSTLPKLRVHFGINTTLNAVEEKVAGSADAYPDRR
jgi:hypothetical protein